MSTQTFQDYLRAKFSSQNSGTVHSYIKAIQILDDIFSQHDVFGLNNQSLADIKDPVLISRIIDYVAEEEDKFRREEDSIFRLGNPNQTSYPKKRFCTAAIRKLGEYINRICCLEATNIMMQEEQNGAKLSRKLRDRFNINEEGTDRIVRAKHRLGQDIFRAMLLDIYSSKCCLTGIDIPEVLRASHIIPWAENSTTRLNPENGLCLSATYDAAFDKYLITFDEDYRLVLSPFIKEVYTSEAFHKYFLAFEGKAIELPTLYAPSQNFLQKHRERLLEA